GSKGMIVFAPAAAAGLSKVSADGGEAEEILRPDSSQHETGLRWPEFLPDGKHFLFLSLPSRQGSFDVQLASTDSKQRRRLLGSSAAPVYAEPGYLLLVRNGRLLAQRFDARGLKAVGAPIPLGEAPPPSFSRGG